MSGHSKWSTIKHKKEVTDQARGKAFSKLVKMISVAVKVGGGANSDTNQRLAAAITQAKAANMPLSNIERAIKSAQKAGVMEEITYEAFGPKGVAIMVETATDNKNRTAQEIKNILEKAGGSLGGPGSVSFNFEPKGLVVLKKEKDYGSQMLQLIDAGAEEIEEAGPEVEVYIPATKLFEFKQRLGQRGVEVISFGLVQKPKNLTTLLGSDEKMAHKLLDALSQHDDVQNVFTNLA